MITEQGKLRRDERGYFDLDDPMNRTYLLSKGIAAADLEDVDAEIIDSAEPELPEPSSRSCRRRRRPVDIMSDIPPELAGMTIIDLLKQALPSGGANIPPRTWVLIWRTLQRARLYDQTGDSEKQRFERNSGLPWAVSGRTVHEAVNFLMAFENRVRFNTPHWTEIFPELCQMFGIK